MTINCIVNRHVLQGLVTCVTLLRRLHVTVKHARLYSAVSAVSGVYQILLAGVFLRTYNMIQHSFWKNLTGYIENDHSIRDLHVIHTCDHRAIALLARGHTIKRNATKTNVYDYPGNTQNMHLVVFLSIR